VANFADQNVVFNSVGTDILDNAFKGMCNLQNSVADFCPDPGKKNCFSKFLLDIFLLNYAFSTIFINTKSINF
jgi:hypothetical protein